MKRNIIFAIRTSVACMSPELIRSNISGIMFDYIGRHTKGSEIFTEFSCRFF